MYVSYKVPVFKYLKLGGVEEEIKRDWVVHRAHRNVIDLRGRNNMRCIQEWKVDFEESLQDTFEITTRQERSISVLNNKC